MENRITINPALCHGKPCVRGLRFPVESVLEWLAGGMTPEHNQAVLAYAARLAHVNRIERLAA